LIEKVDVLEEQVHQLKKSCCAKKPPEPPKPPKPTPAPPRGPRDCQDLMDQHIADSGVQTIYVGAARQAVKVMCRPHGFTVRI